MERRCDPFPPWNGTVDGILMLGQRILHIIKVHYRDIVGWLFMLVVYPLLTVAGYARPGSESFRAMALLLFALILAGVVGNLLKLRSLDPAIVATGGEDQVQCYATRFLAGLVALPVLLIWPPMGYFGDAGVNVIGPIYLVLAPMLWALILHYGKGKSGAAPNRLLGRLGGGLLLLFEFTMYALFLDIFWASDPYFHLTFSALLIIAIPMTGLFFLMFLPATIGFYVEEIIATRSWKIAAFRLWYRFLLHRYLPAFGVFYLEQRGVELPWVKWIL